MINTDTLFPGNIIVMWDGKSFGFYPDLPTAIADAKRRITKEHYYSPPDDYECLEFLEVLDEDPGTLRSMCHDGPGFLNENGVRISFGYPVADRGNQIDQLKE